MRKVTLHLTPEAQLKIEIIQQAGHVVASHPDFWRKGNVNALPSDELKIQTLRLRCAAELKNAVERNLDERAWFSHRRFDAFERTLQFVSQHDQMLMRFMPFNAELSSEWRGALRRRGHYLPKAVLNHPWAERTEAGKWRRPAAWSCYVTARRKADQHGIPYEEYLAAAFVCMNARGWQFANSNSPSLLGSEKLWGGQDKFEAATIRGVLNKRYAETLRVCDDPYYQAQNYVGAAMQNAYLGHFAHELLRLYGEVVGAQKWRAYVKIGQLPLTISYDQALAFLPKRRTDDKQALT